MERRRDVQTIIWLLELKVKASSFREPCLESRGKGLERTELSPLRSQRQRLLFRRRLRVRRLGLEALSANSVDK
jgi:hypothetical protein